MLELYCTVRRTLPVLSEPPCLLAVGHCPPVVSSHPEMGKEGADIWAGFSPAHSRRFLSSFLGVIFNGIGC